MDDNTSLELKPEQVQAVLYLARGRSAHDVGKIIGFSEQTISAWRNKDEGFVKALAAESKRVEEKLRRELDEAVRFEQSVQRKALEVLNAALDSKEPGIAIRAAQIVRRGA